MVANPNNFNNLSEQETLVLNAAIDAIDAELRLSYVPGKTVPVRNSILALVYTQNPRVLEELICAYKSLWDIAQYKDGRGMPWLSFAARADMLDENDGYCFAFKTVFDDYTITLDDFAIWVDASAGPVTITMPNADIADCRRYSIKKIDTSANNVLIYSASTIDGFTTYALDVPYEAATLLSNGVVWGII